MYILFLLILFDFMREKKSIFCGKVPRPQMRITDEFRNNGIFFGNNLSQNCFIPSNFESSDEFEDLSNLSTLNDNVFFLVISFRGSDVLVVFGEAISTASIFLTLKSMASLLHSGKFANILFTLLQFLFRFLFLFF